MVNDKTAAQKNASMLGALGGYRLGQNTPVDLALDSSQKLADKEQAAQEFQYGKDQQDKQFSLAQQNQKQAHEDSLAATSANRDFSIKQHEGQRTTDRLSKLSQSLDPSAMTRGPFSISKSIIDRADRLRTLDEYVNNYQQGNADSRQIEELAIGMNALLSGSNTGAQKQVESLVPKSAMGNATKLAEWLKNEPTGTNQQAFVQRMMGTVENEKKTAENQIKKTRYSRIAQFDDVKDADPLKWENVLRSNDVDPDEYDKYKANGYKFPDVVKSGAPSSIQGQLSAPKTQQEYDALPSGATYVDTDGVTKRKK
jgi:hypothetical protein